MGIGVRLDVVEFSCVQSWAIAINRRRRQGSFDLFVVDEKHHRLDVVGDW